MKDIILAILFFLVVLYFTLAPAKREVVYNHLGEASHILLRHDSR
jgi:hypothetical protein